jgi:hypothetical protein
MGRVVGTGTGWDQADTFVMQIYDFEPAAKANLPKTDCLTINFEDGTAETYTEEGLVMFTADLVTVLAGLKRTGA